MTDPSPERFIESWSEPPYGEGDQPYNTIIVRDRIENIGAEPAVKMLKRKAERLEPGGRLIIKITPDPNWTPDIWMQDKPPEDVIQGMFDNYDMGMKLRRSERFGTQDTWLPQVYSNILASLRITSPSCYLMLFVKEKLND